jgi:hypothetical protein
MCSTMLLLMRLVSLMSLMLIHLMLGSVVRCCATVKGKRCEQGRFRHKTSSEPT